MDQATGRLEVISVGGVQRLSMPDGLRVDYRHANWTSGIFKQAVAGPVEISAAGIAGDGQADLENHGGPDNVVLAYDVGHYAYWREALKMPEIGAGAFGENFSVSGYTDSEVCVGDIWEVGEAGEVGGLQLQVTQARMPCYKLARRLGQPHIVKMVHENGWGGWYLRVVRAGVAEAGMAIRRVARFHSEWPVTAAVQVMYALKKNREKARLLLAVTELSARWKEQLADER